jgi:hypothetical protein
MPSSESIHNWDMQPTNKALRHAKDVRHHHLMCRHRGLIHDAILAPGISCIFSTQCTGSTADYVCMSDRRPHSYPTITSMVSAGSTTAPHHKTATVLQRIHQGPSPVLLHHQRLSRHGPLRSHKGPQCADNVPEVPSCTNAAEIVQTQLAVFADQPFMIWRTHGIETNKSKRQAIGEECTSCRKRVLQRRHVVLTVGTPSAEPEKGCPGLQRHNRCEPATPWLKSPKQSAPLLTNRMTVSVSFPGPGTNCNSTQQDRHLSTSVKENPANCGKKAQHPGTAEQPDWAHHT